MKKSKVCFKNKNVEIVIEIEHLFSCDEDEIIELAENELRYA